MDLKCEKNLNGRKEQDQFYLFIRVTIDDFPKYNSQPCLAICLRNGARTGEIL